MKRSLRYLMIGLVGCLDPEPFNASADLEVSAAVQIHAATEFHAPLAPHGVWVDVGPYGRCWRPAHVAVSWRPYCYGHWVWTDCGWFWESDEPWAWACYHYGWWVEDPAYGWVWVPGVEWAPAWVTWRVGGGYCGWAPLPPRGVIVPVPGFVFVEAHRFHEPVTPSVVVMNNMVVLNKTKEVAGFKRETRNLNGSGPQNVIVNEGPGIDIIQKATGKKTEAVPIREAARQTPLPEAMRKAQPLSGSEKPSAALPPRPREGNPDAGQFGGRPHGDRGNRGGGRGKDR